VPRSADVYIHRNGRTARAERPGVGLLLCAPDERKLLRALFKNLGRGKRIIKVATHFIVNILAGEDEILDLPVERDLLDRLKNRVELAREIDRIQHGVTKENHDKNWLRAMAEALEIDPSDEE
jgi:ATP-dependent RNA helicase DDX24/MAK5